MDKWLCGDRQDIEILIKKHRKNRQGILKWKMLGPLIFMPLASLIQGDIVNSAYPLQLRPKLFLLSRQEKKMQKTL